MMLLFEFGLEYQSMARLVQYLISLSSVLACYCFTGEGVSEEASIKWKRHVVTTGKLNMTAVALDVNGDKQQDVITSYGGKVALFVAPQWKQEVVLHEFIGGRRSSKKKCIHSAVLDVDGDRDLDWAGGEPGGLAFWLENPGTKDFDNGAWVSRVLEENSQEHKDWPNKPKEVPPKDVSGTQNIDVPVGGHPLDPSIQNREVKFTTPKRLKIKWPN